MYSVRLLSVKAAENIEDDIRVEDEVFIVHTKSVNEDDAEKQPNSGSVVYI